MRIFISAVTNEFGKARDALAADLRARGHTVSVQSDFQQSPNSETLLGRLDKYIRDCNAVICIVGKHCGACPPGRAAERLPDVLPKDIRKASYTQWEFFLARHYKRRPYMYRARDDYTPDRTLASGDNVDLQNAYVEFLKADGVHYGPFSNVDQLARAVFRDLPELAPEPIVPTQPAKPIVLPYPSIGDLFKGRDAFMQRLHESLMRSRGGRTAIVSQALYGLGGIGKTRAAVEYAWAHADEHTALLFAVAETPEALRRNLAALAGALLPQLDTTDDAARLAAVLDWLKANPGWFLILDNVDSKPALAEVEHLLSEFTSGHVVVTSRLADFSGHFQPLELDVLAVEDAAAFLLARTEGRRRVAPDDAAKAREVAEELGRLALALEQAAAFIAKRRLTFAQYLEQWRSKRDEVLKWWDATVTGYPRAVAATWQTSVNELSEVGRRLLERLAWLGAEPVPNFFISMVGNTHFRGANDIEGAYVEIAGLCLIQRSQLRDEFSIHRLVQDMTRRTLSEHARQDSLQDVLDWIHFAFVTTANNFRSWREAEVLLPHAIAVAEETATTSISVWKTKDLLSEIAALLREKCQYSLAEPFYRQALTFAEKHYHPEHSQVGACLNNLALVLVDRGQLSDAEPLYRRALAILAENHSDDHPDLSFCRSNLAGLLVGAGRLSEAEPLYRQALASTEKVRGLDDPSVATILNNLANLLLKANRFSEAEPLFQRALAIDEDHYGSEHPGVAIDLLNLAELLKATNRLAGAEPLMRRAVAIFLEFTRRTGHRHPHLDQAFANYAGLLEAMGKGHAEIEAACAALMRPLSAPAIAGEGDRPKGGGGALAAKK